MSADKPDYVTTTPATRVELLTDGRTRFTDPDGTVRWALDGFALAGDVKVPYGSSYVFGSEFPAGTRFFMDQEEEWQRLQAWLPGPPAPRAEPIDHQAAAARAQDRVDAMLASALGHLYEAVNYLRSSMLTDAKFRNVTPDDDEWGDDFYAVTLADRLVDHVIYETERIARFVGGEVRSGRR